jgi:hypothetical protein
MGFLPLAPLALIDMSYHQTFRKVSYLHPQAQILAII